MLKGSINLPVFQNYLGPLAIGVGPYVDSAPDVIDVCFQLRQDGGLVHALSSDACLSSPAEEKERVSTIATVINQCVLPLNQQTSPTNQTT